VRIEWDSQKADQNLRTRFNLAASTCGVFNSIDSDSVYAEITYGGGMDDEIERLFTKDFPQDLV